VPAYQSRYSTKALIVHLLAYLIRGWNTQLWRTPSYPASVSCRWSLLTTCSVPVIISSPAVVRLLACALFRAPRYTPSNLHSALVDPLTPATSWLKFATAYSGLFGFVKGPRCLSTKGTSGAA